MAKKFIAVIGERDGVYFLDPATGRRLVVAKGIKEMGFSDYLNAGKVVPGLGIFLVDDDNTIYQFRFTGTQVSGNTDIPFVSNSQCELIETATKIASFSSGGNIYVFNKTNLGLTATTFSLGSVSASFGASQSITSDVTTERIYITTNGGTTLASVNIDGTSLIEATDPDLTGGTLSFYICRALGYAITRDSNNPHKVVKYNPSTMDKVWSVDISQYDLALDVSSRHSPAFLSQAGTSLIVPAYDTVGTSNGFLELTVSDGTLNWHTTTVPPGYNQFNSLNLLQATTGIGTDIGYLTIGNIALGNQRMFRILSDWSIDPTPIGYTDDWTAVFRTVELPTYEITGTITGGDTEVFLYDANAFDPFQPNVSYQLKELDRTTSVGGSYTLTSIVDGSNLLVLAKDPNDGNVFKVKAWLTGTPV